MGNALDSTTYLDQQKALHGGRIVLDGVDRTGSASTSAVFKTAMGKARDARTAAPGMPDLVTPSPKVIDLQPGIYTVDEAAALIGAEAPSAQTRGLHFRGAGSGVTTIVFTPGSAGIMASVRFWQNIRFSGITFACSSAAAGSTFMQINNDTDAVASQDFIFYDCSWVGPWKYIIDPAGVNNASEMRFVACEAALIQDDGAWLHISDTNTSDQFLNYWFYGCKHTSTSASVVDIAMGGSVHIYGLDVSDWGKSGSGILFALRGHTHARGVTQFHAEGVRLENKSTSSKPLYSEWDNGNVTLQIDMGSQADAFTYGTMIELNLGNADGANYHIHDSMMAGQIKVSTGSGGWQHAYGITVEDTTWLQAVRPSDVVVHDMAGMDLGAPVNFVRCRPEGNASVLEGGIAVWDATVGRGQMGLPTQKRSVLVRGVWGGFSGPSDTATILLPVGAIVTGFRAVGPSGSASDADGGTFVLKSNGTQVGTAVISGSTSAGYNAGGDLAVPVACTDAASATLTVTSADVTSAPHDALVIVEGYW